MAFDPSADNAKRLADFGRNTLGLDVEIVNDPKQAVTGCDIVVYLRPDP